MKIDYNRLFGMLAVQAGYLDRDRLDDIWNDWQSSPTETSFAELLVRRRVVTEDLLARFEERVDRPDSLLSRQRSHADEPTASIEAGPQDGARNKTQLHVSQTAEERPNRLLPIETVDMPTQQRERYSLTRVHGEGGLGRVWLALDTRLNREIALKEIRPDREVAADDLRRFVREAQVTGQLEHPHIVPLYELAQNEDGGSPFYTMRFLRGRTLGDAIHEYHEKRQQHAASPLDLRLLLDFFVSVCHAVAYAHSRGVVHRDIKPGNVMLGDFGEVVLVDWGLAKLVGEPDDPDARRLDLVADEHETQYGEALGTPVFMAPEQAEGKIDLIDARTDIYGLGALLFAILTGAGPHARLSQKSPKNTNELLRWIIESPTPRARHVDPLVPPALEAICAKAMSKRRGDRYQSASELADDVTHWLADEPVACFREPRRDRVARWMRRHRTWTQAVAASLLIITVVSIVAALVVNRARQQQQIARAEATRRFQDARRAVDTSLMGVSKVLEFYPGVQKLRQRLLEQAAEDYRRFAAEKSDNPQLLAESGRALLRLGDVHRLLANDEEAKKAYESAISLFQELVASAPDHGQLRRELANARNRLGVALTNLGQHAEADQAFQTAIAALHALLVRAPDDAEHRRALAAALVNHAQLKIEARELAEALAELQQAETEFKRVTATTGQPQHRADLATTQMTIGHVLIELERYQEAITALNDAKHVYERLERDEPDNPDHLLGRANSSISIGNAGRLLGEDEVEELAYRDAIRDLELLIKIRPEIPVYHANLAITRLDLAQLLRGLDRTAEAKFELEKGLESFDQWSQLGISDPQRYVFRLAVCRLTYGLMLYDLDADTEAELQLGDAISLLEQLCGRFDRPNYHLHLAVARVNLGRLKTKSGEYDDAKQSFLAAMGDFGKADAQLDSTRDALAWCHTYLADLLWLRGDAQEAHAFYQKALDTREHLNRHPDQLYELAHLLATCRDPQVQDSNRAADVAQRAIDLVRQNAKYWTMLGAARYRAGDYQGSIEAIDEARRLDNRGGAFGLFHLAMALWKSGDEQTAGNRFDQAVAAMQKDSPGRLELIQLRDEAAELLGRPDGTQPADDKKSEQTGGPDP